MTRFNRWLKIVHYASHGMVQHACKACHTGGGCSGITPAFGWAQREIDSMNCQDMLLHNCLQQSSLHISPAHTFLPVSNQLVFQAFELHRSLSRKKVLQAGLVPEDVLYFFFSRPKVWQTIDTRHLNVPLYLETIPIFLSHISGGTLWYN